VFVRIPVVAESLPSRSSESATGNLNFWTAIADLGHRHILKGKNHGCEIQYHQHATDAEPPGGRPSVWLQRRGSHYAVGRTVTAARMPNAIDMRRMPYFTKSLYVTTSLPFN
jgi:hypothetical protein